MLEAVSFTRKDGQYLRWDAPGGKARVTGAFDKGEVLDFPQAIRAKLLGMCEDLAGSSGRELFETSTACPPGTVDIRRGSCLDILPTLATQSIDLVVTSPPYCNRYDYTRTYALELVFLGCDAPRVQGLRRGHPLLHGGEP